MRSLEAIGVLEKDDDKGGRRITQSGQRDLDRKSYLDVVTIGKEYLGIVCQDSSPFAIYFGVDIQACTNMNI